VQANLISMKYQSSGKYVRSRLQISFPANKLRPELRRRTAFGSRERESTHQKGYWNSIPWLGNIPAHRRATEERERGIFLGGCKNFTSCTTASNFAFSPCAPFQHGGDGVGGLVLRESFLHSLLRIRRSCKLYNNCFSYHNI
jgi:hypothetical protein